MGVFVAFEGIDGCGKGTQIHLTEKWLFNKDKKNTVLVTRNPYSYPQYEAEYERIRAFLKKMKDSREHAQTLAELFVSNRIYHSTNAVVPALQNGWHVLTDRYDLSTLAYQGGLQGIPILDLIKMHHGVRMPDLTVLFDVPAEVGLERRASDQGLVTREVFDKMKIPEMDRLRQAYLTLPSQLLGRRIVVIDGTPAPEIVFESVKKEIEKLFSL